jgi:hypothetical protein
MISLPWVGREDKLAWLRPRGECGGESALIALAGQRGAGERRLTAGLAGDAQRRRA